MCGQMNTNTNACENDRNDPDAVLRQMIEERAYHIWLESGCGHGDHEDHWFQAEREVLEAANLDPENDLPQGKKDAANHIDRGDKFSPRPKDLKI